MTETNEIRHQAIKTALLKLHSAVFIGISGIVLTEEEQKWLQHPLVGGVILFSRNYRDIEQLKALTASIKAINPQLLISVDHEGGRVQRFREGFTALAPMRALGDHYDNTPEEALTLAFNTGYTIARELQSVGVDFSYAPVCDLDYGVNPAIGDRAFHRDGKVVAKLVLALYEGLKAGGSIGVAKHFPGHGFVNVDTHLAIARDDRSLAELEDSDLLPFKTLINASIEALMPAHIIFSCLDAEHTVITSHQWLNYLRHQLKFSGAIISDDLDMGGANHLGSVDEKVKACFDAGINIVLLCNDMTAIRSLLQRF
ncbi:beta-N-acetylhexosaminidase [Ignatzschineria larvae DSM 13226]|uniref:beta-N-acetylhexosaminidase n=1 Tax=Ignatzschineria larvae DSM 13226 TaxID=1111732 RepID=A0ABZ3C0C6_9GAMM